MARSFRYAELMREELQGRFDVDPGWIERIADQVHQELNWHSGEPLAIAELLKADIKQVPFLSADNPGCTIQDGARPLILIWDGLSEADMGPVILHECGHVAFDSRKQSYTHADVNRLALAYAYPRDVLLELHGANRLTPHDLFLRGHLARSYAALRIDQAVRTRVLFTRRQLPHGAGSRRR